MIMCAMNLVSGCASNCVGVKPIRPTKKDIEVMSDSLSREILAHNKYLETSGIFTK